MIQFRSDTYRSHTTSRPHWSYSQLAQYLRCPLQYYFERVLKLVRPSQPASLVLGAVVHEVLAAYHHSIIDHEPLTAHVLGDCFIKAWNARADLRPIQFRDGESSRDVIDRGIALVELYQHEPTPQDISAVEHTITVPLQTSAGRFLERPLVAVIDLIRSNDHELRAIEFKTSARRYSQSEVDTSLQANCYAHALTEFFGQPSAIEYIVLVKTATPAIQHLQTARTTENSTRLGDLCQTIGRAVQQRIFYPIESPQNCSTCAFREPCRTWRGQAGSSRNEIRFHQVENVPC